MSPKKKKERVSKNPFANKKKEEAMVDLSNLPSIEDDKHNIAERCKFNFSYFDTNQSNFQSFSGWNEDQLIKLFGKLRDFSKESLEHWEKEEVGTGKFRGKVAVEYKEIPEHSNARHPLHVPKEASWYRFRLGGSARLIGFVLPDKFDGKLHNSTQKVFDCNIFYVVFLDRDHLFYPPR